MNINERDQLHRAVRDAVFLGERLRRAGDTLAATEVLESELAAAQGRLSAAGTPDAAGLVHQWQMEAEAAFALAHLISELVADRIQSVDTPGPPQAHARPIIVEPPLSALPSVASAAPPAPDLADLLDGMFTEERKTKRRPP